jgi:hypothetical protein
MRSEIVAGLNEMASLNTKDNVCNELKRSRILRDNADLRAVCHVIEESAFSPSLQDDILYNIGTGKAATEKLKNIFLVQWTDEAS